MPKTTEKERKKKKRREKKREEKKREEKREGGKEKRGEERRRKVKIANPLCFFFFLSPNVSKVFTSLAVLITNRVLLLGL